jgi:DNA-binding HxlR family transcriptional regulator
MPELPELNPVIHGKLRLALLSLLVSVEEAEFTWLRAKTGSTDGNLGAQLLKLEEAGYVTVEKRFVQRKPQTLYRISEAGRTALSEYVQALKTVAGRSDQRIRKQKNNHDENFPQCKSTQWPGDRLNLLCMFWNGLAVPCAHSRGTDHTGDGHMRFAVHVDPSPCLPVPAESVQALAPRAE